MWDLDYKESWALKDWCFWIVGEDSWESLGLLGQWLGEPVHPKGNQSWMFIGRTDAEAETPILWPSDAKNWLVGKDPDAGKDWRQEEKGTTEDEMVGWHHWLYGHEFEQALGVGDGQGSLACSSPWDHKYLDMAEWLNWHHEAQMFFMQWLLQSLHGHFLSLFWNSQCHIFLLLSVWLGASKKWRTWDPAPDLLNQICMFSRPPGGTVALKFAKHWLYHSKAPPSWPWM